jgi:ribosome-associated heat shock protein Hsp15
VSDGERHRLDKWLWCARFYKTRGLATEAVSGGRVKVDGERAKPSHALRIGERLTIGRQDDTQVVDVLAFPERRGPASEARACYAETPESITHRAAVAEQKRLADVSRQRPDLRPDKRERRELDRLKRSQG